MTTGTMYSRYQKQRIARINPSRNYNITDIASENIFWWIIDFRSVRDVVKREQKCKNILDVIITGEGRRRRYLITGKSLIAFIKYYGPGIDLVRK